MTLTAAQLAALATDIAANQNTAPGTAGAISALAHTHDNAFAVAAWYNLFPAVDFFGNYKTVPVSAIKGAIAFKNYTPADEPPASGATTQVTNDLLNYIARALYAQTFQFSVNNLFLGVSAGGSSVVFDATNPTLVASLKDATNTNMPTGAAGADQKGGWGGASGVQSVLCRKGTNLEKLFANTGGGTGADSLHAATFAVEGAVSNNDVNAAWGI